MTSRTWVAFALLLLQGLSLSAGTHTWDGRYDTSQIEVTVVYFVPEDRHALPDWRDRVDYFCRRIEQFHQREFGMQSKLKTRVHPEPLVSELSTEQLREGDANAIYFRTLNEADRRLKFAAERDNSGTFPILLVLSEINWRPLDDFFRVAPRDGKLVFEGNYNGGQHFPGAASGGARAAYLADRGVGWGLVSADGWRVPYRGSDCVIYHEGCGHTVGLPHPEPGNGSVMSLGQYRGWISESWLDKEQKLKLGWEPAEPVQDEQQQLFDTFRALPEPRIPAPGESVSLKLDWPAGVKCKSLRVRFQTSVRGPWVDVVQTWDGDLPRSARLTAFDRATPVSYRVDAELTNGATAELWGYFQVRETEQTLPLPPPFANELQSSPPADASDDLLDGERWGDAVDLLALARSADCWQVGEWGTSERSMTSPKRFGARLELPYTPPAEYRMTLIVEPLDQPNGLILGQRSGENRFVTLLNYTPAGESLSALENIDGRNVGNATTARGPVFLQNQLSQVIVTVQSSGVLVEVDGKTLIRWRGKPASLSLSDYWQTPRQDALFLGSYDCRYTIHRMTIQPLVAP